MRTATPWWLSWAHLFALLVLLFSQRFLGPWATLQWFTTVATLVAIFTVLGIRVLAVVRTHDARRRVERTLLLATAGTVLSIVFYALSTRWGMHFVGQASLKDTGTHHWRTAMYALSAAAAIASVLPIIMIEAVLGTPRRERIDLGGAGDDTVEYRRVREVGLAGLTVAFAAALLMTTCSVAHQRNHRTDVSYFRTSAAGDSTKRILQNTSEPITVLLFFPAVNEVKDEVRHYFEELKSATGKVTIEEHDLVADPALATRNKVTKDGSIVLVRGEGDAAKSEKFEMDTDYEKARRATKAAATTHPGLRNLDSAVNQALMKLVREKRKAYLTVGHGEINDPDSIDPTMRDRMPDARATVIKSVLTSQNYEVKNLGVMDGLDSKVPDDATMVLVLGPHQAFGDDELAALDAYVKGGGNLLVSLDPDGDAVMGPLEQTLGVHFDKNPIVDDKEFVEQRGPRVPVTNQFSSHASITSLSKVASNVGLPLLVVGSLEDVGAAGGDDQNKRTYVIRSMESSFRDLDNSGSFSDGTEKRDRYNVAAAIEGPAGEAGKPGFRAMVFADREFFVDRPVQQGGQMYLTAWGGPMVADAIRWIGGEVDFAGEVTNEDDVAIEQTHKQQAWWFLLTIFVSPVLLLSIGLTLSKTLNPARRRKYPKVAPPTDNVEKSS
jgi:hypothetical protein